MDNLNEHITKAVEAHQDILCIECYPGRYVSKRHLWLVKALNHYYQGQTLTEALEKLEEGVDQ